LHWIHSRKQFLQDVLRIQNLSLEEENQEKEALEVQLEMMKKPFGFISAYYKQEEILQDENRLSADPVKREQQLMMMEYTKVTATEKKIE